VSALDITLRAAREGLLLAIIVSAPFVIVAMAVGLVVSVMQAATQIQEQTLSFAPKLIAVALTLAILGPWVGAELVRFTVAIFERIPHLGMH
jgi:flagellar biosynthetic protein FliQ